jgi:hypothetical protein
MFTTFEYSLEAQVRDQQERLEGLRYRRRTSRVVRRRTRGQTRDRKRYTKAA